MSNDRELLERIVKAWSVEGKSPAYHRRAVRDLRDNWPTLANAIQESVVHVVTTTPLDAIVDPDAEVHAFMLDVEKEELNSHIESLKVDIAKQKNTPVDKFMSVASIALVYISGAVMLTFVFGLLIAAVAFVVNTIGDL